MAYTDLPHIHILAPNGSIFPYFTDLTTVRALPFNNFSPLADLAFYHAYRCAPLPVYHFPILARIA